VPGDERSQPQLIADDARAARLLERGEMEILGLLPRSSNYTFLARVSDVDRRALAVYKPRAGETPLWDFPDGTLGKREVAAHLVATELGRPWIPQTVYRDGPEGPGSVQRFVDFDPQQHSFTLLEGRNEIFRGVALFDVVANNADRKAGHCLLAKDGRVFAIDHGLCFALGPRLRTVIWDFAGDELAGEERAALDRLRTALAGGNLRARLLELLEVEEVDATGDRVSALLEAGRFPHPGPDHPYPWPAI